jgi:hypothetical protein
LERVSPRWRGQSGGAHWWLQRPVVLVTGSWVRDEWCDNGVLMMATMIPEVTGDVQSPGRQSCGYGGGSVLPRLSTAAGA